MIARNDPTKNFEIFTELSNNSNFKNMLNPKFQLLAKIQILFQSQKITKIVYFFGYKKNIQDFLNLVDVLVLISKGEDS